MDQYFAGKSQNFQDTVLEILKIVIDGEDHLWSIRIVCFVEIYGQ